MLPKPSIFKLPQLSSSVFNGLTGCNTGYTYQCVTGYTACVDTYTGCSWGLSVNVGGIIVVVGIGAIALT